MCSRMLARISGYHGCEICALTEPVDCIDHALNDAEEGIDNPVLRQD